jgi:hypothetical protein
VIVSDSNTCPRRLLPLRDGSGNVIPGFIIYTGSGQQEQVIVTNQPSVPVPAVVVGSGQSFGALLIATGAAGLFQVVTPPGAANLFLQTDGAGALEFAGPPVVTVPDPLSVNTLNVATALNVAGLTTFTGNIVSAVAAGTIVSLLGIDATNKFVSGAVSLIDMAWFYETSNGATPPGPGNTFPNSGLYNGQNPSVAFPLYVSGGIASVGTGGTQILINVTGTYRVEWSGAFGTNSGGTATPGLGLIVNGNLVNPGPRRLQTTGPGNYLTTQVCGTHVAQINAGGYVQLQVINPNPAGFTDTTASGSALNLRDVGVTLTRFK